MCQPAHLTPDAEVVQGCPQRRVFIFEEVVVVVGSQLGVVEKVREVSSGIVVFVRCSMGRRGRVWWSRALWGRGARSQA
jgi:hypothetical protein